LTKSTVAVEEYSGKRTVYVIPADSIVSVVKKDGRLADVEWESRIFAMFLVDLEERGEPLDALTI
jgi:hypothetical protein